MRSARYRDALHALQEGDTDVAFSGLIEAARQDPEADWVNAFRFWQVLRRRISDGEFAWSQPLERCFEELHQAAPQCPIRAVNYAEVCLRLGRRRRALELLARAAVAAGTDRSQPPADPGAAAAPTFSIIGAMKSGTTSLYEYLIQHPRAAPAARKEIDYWSWKFHRGPDWYAAHFPPSPGGERLVTGDACPTYLQHDEAPQRIQEHRPDLRIIAVLRNPVERTISHHHHNARRFSDERSLGEAIQAQLDDVEAGRADPQRLDNAVASSLYAPHIARWLACFSSEQVCVLFSESLFHRPQDAMNRIHAFLDLEPQPLADAEPRNAARYADCDAATLRRLEMFFEPSILELERLLGRSTGWLR